MGEGVKVLPLSCFQGFPALIYKHKTSLGISLVREKKKKPWTPSDESYELVLEQMFLFLSQKWK